MAVGFRSRFVRVESRIGRRLIDQSIDRTIDCSEEHFASLLAEEVPGGGVAGAPGLDGEEEVVVPRGGGARQRQLQLGQILKQKDFLGFVNTKVKKLLS